MKGKILLIDDNKLNQALIKDVFENEGYNVIVVSTALEGNKRVYSETFSLLLVNHKLPDINGIEIVKEIRKNPLLSHLPIVILTDVDDPSTENQIRQAGVDDYIKQPVSSTVLLLKVHSLLEKAESTSLISPIINLPGGFAFQKEIENKLKNQEKFGVLYAEVENIEQYSKIFGSKRSEEIIKFTFDIIRQNIPPSSKIFHITLNSFGILCLSEDVPLIGNGIVEKFNKEILNYYSEKISLINICVVGASNYETPFSNYGEVAKVMFELINYAKKFSKSIFIMNRRKRI